MSGGDAPNRSVKLVAFDVDGTLVGSDLTVSPRVREAVAAMLARGVLGTLVTGRMYRAALPYARVLEFETPIVCYQGAAVIDPRSGDRILDLPLSSGLAREVVDLAQRDGLHVQLYADDRYYCEERNAYSALYASVSGVEPLVVTSLHAAFAGRDATKAVIIAEPQVAAECHLRMQLALGDRAYVTRSLPEFVEVMNPLVDKGRALRVVAERLGVPIEAVMAIGDSWNDAPLLHAAGIGVAMGSAPQDLRDSADAVVADVEHDGVAEALERYVLR